MKSIGEQLTLFAGDSPARTSQPREKNWELPVSGPAYGETSPVLLAKFDHVTRLWKTSQLCLDGDLQTFSETLPRSGLMQNGIAYQLQPLVPLTKGTESGLLPTPSATEYGTNQGGGAGRVGKVRPSLQTMARQNLWPTPKAADSNPAGGAAMLRYNERTGRKTLMTEVQKYPTPSHNWGNSGMSNSGDIIRIRAAVDRGEMTLSRRSEAHPWRYSQKAPEPQTMARERFGTLYKSQWEKVFGENPWTVEPDVGRVAHGISHRVDRLKGLGNAVVPQIPELIGRAIMSGEI